MEQCRPIPSLPNEIWDTKITLTDCNAPNRKAYDKVVDKVVEIDAGQKPLPRANSETMVGSGFWVQDGTHVVTNTHVALMGPYLEVVDSQGKRYHASIEKMNDLADLAVLKVDGIQPDSARAVPIKVADNLKSGDSIIALGHADGEPEAVLSAGTFREKGKFKDLLIEAKEDVKPIIDLSKSHNKRVAADAKAFLEGERIHARINFHHGDSGGLAVTPDLDLVGVVAFRMNQAHGLLIPGSKVADILSKPESKFSFKYQTDNYGNNKLVAIERKNGSSAPPISLKLPVPRQASLGKYDLNEPVTLTQGGGWRFPYAIYPFRTGRPDEL